MASSGQCHARVRRADRACDWIMGQDGLTPSGINFWLLVPRGSSVQLWAGRDFVGSRTLSPRQSERRSPLLIPGRLNRRRAAMRWR